MKAVIKQKKFKHIHNCYNGKYIIAMYEISLMTKYLLLNNFRNKLIIWCNLFDDFHSGFNTYKILEISTYYSERYLLYRALNITYISLRVLKYFCNKLHNMKNFIVLSNLNYREESTKYYIPKAHKHVNLIFKTSLAQYLNVKPLHIPNIYHTKLIRNKLHNIYNEIITNNNYKPVTSSMQSRESTQYNLVGTIKHYPPAGKEWLNSIYVYNKSTAKVLPTSDWRVSNLLKSYFNSYSRKLEGKIKKKRSRKSRILGARLTTNRVLISRSEVKHSNDKAFITLYVYNNEKKLYFGKLRRMDENITDDLSYIMIKNICLNLKCKMYEHKLSLHKLLYNKKPILYNMIANIYENKYTQNFVRRYLRKQIVRAHIKQLIRYNQLKFEKQFVLPLTKQVEYIYNKKVEFNFVNQKHLHLNSNILSAALITKLKKRSNKILEVLNRSLAMFNIPELNRLAVYKDMYNKEMLTQNVRVKNVIDKHYTYNMTNNVNSSHKSFGDAMDALLGLKPIKNKEHFYIRYLCLNYCYYYLNKLNMIDTSYVNFIKQDNLMDVKCKRYLFYNLLNHLRDQWYYLNVCCVYECSAYFEIFYNICRHVVNSENYMYNRNYTDSIKKSIYKNFDVYETNYDSADIYDNKSRGLITSTTITDNHDSILLLKKLNLIIPGLSEYFHRLVWLNKLNEVMRISKTKSVSGLRLELAGRLTPRNTADRSITKLAYKGSIRNMDSSDKGLSTVMLRGNNKSNLQYNRAKSKRRIGSFGLKGWVSAS